jgi:uncharacterized membrane protein YidH (DUF202 family)
MVAKLKSFLNPQTQEQMYQRIIGVLIACIALIFIALLVSRWQDVHSSIYISSGDAVLKVSADNRYVIYKIR